jgi:hypothetical protein
MNADLMAMGVRQIRSTAVDTPSFGWMALHIVGRGGVTIGARRMSAEAILDQHDDGGIREDRRNTMREEFRREFLNDVRRATS